MQYGILTMLNNLRMNVIQTANNVIANKKLEENFKMDTAGSKEVGTNIFMEQ